MADGDAAGAATDSTDLGGSKFASTVSSIFTSVQTALFGTPSPQSVFTTLPAAPAAAEGPTGTDIINHRLRADPDTAGRARAVEMDPAAPNLFALLLDVNSAITDMNEVRAAAGKEPIKFDPAQLVKNLQEFDPSSGGISIDLGKEPDGKHISIDLISKGGGADLVDGASVAPVTESFKDQLRKNDPDGTLTPLHESGHAIEGNDGGPHGEKSGDIMYLAAVADLLPDTKAALAFLKAEADNRSLESDSAHFLAGDTLLRMRHDLETDPAGFSARLDALPKDKDGKPLLSAVSALGIERYVGPSDAALPNDDSTQAALDFGRKRIAHFDQVRDGVSVDEQAVNPPIPATLDRDGAVALLRMQQSVEENTLDGRANGLTAAMPELREKNPDAFAQADTYMHDTYGIDPRQPDDADRKLKLPGDHPSPAEMVNDRLRADPSTNTRIRIVEYDPSDPDSTETFNKFNAALKEISDAREAAHQAPVNLTKSRFDTLFTTINGLDPETSTATINLGTDASGKPIAITIVNPRHQLSDQLDDGSFVPASDAFKEKVRAADHQNLYNTLRETGTDVNGTTQSKTHNAKVGSGMMLLDVANGNPDAAKNLGVEADMASLSTDVSKFMTGDVLLRMKHDVETNPDGLKAQIDALPKGADGQPLIDNIKRLELKNYVLPSDTDLPNLAQTKDALDFAQKKMVHFEEAAQGLPPSGPDPHIPTNLSRDGAVALLRMQMSTEQNSVLGADNGLSAAMPELWQKNPKAFAAAQAYMHDKYGVDVQNPLLPPVLGVQADARPSATVQPKL